MREFAQTFCEDWSHDVGDEGAEMDFAQFSDAVYELKCDECAWPESLKSKNKTISTIEHFSGIYSTHISRVVPLN